MSDHLEELRSAVLELTERLRRLETRVDELAGRPVPSARPVPTAGEPAEAAPSATLVPQGTVALVGRTLLVLAGAYLVRALTDGHVVPAGTGVTLGLVYAVLWLLVADREARSGRRESAVFHALAGSLIAFPLLWETTARFGLLGARAACAALVGFFVLALVVAWRHGLAVVAGAATLLTLATAAALLVATHDLLAVLVALLAVAALLEWLAYHDRWMALRWGAALVLDAVAFLLVALVTRSAGLPEGYVPLASPVAARALFALPALYIVSLAARTLRRERPVTVFEAAQGTLAVVLGFGGAFRVLTAHGLSTASLGVLALLLGALCYGAAFAFAERRAGQGRNFYFYSTAGGFLALAGANIVAFGPALPFALGGLGLLGALFGRRFGRMTLRVHSALYLVAGALETGLLVACARALASQATGSLPPSRGWRPSRRRRDGWCSPPTRALPAPAGRGLRSSCSPPWSSSPWARRSRRACGPLSASGRWGTPASPPCSAPRCSPPSCWVSPSPRGGERGPSWAGSCIRSWRSAG